MGFVENLVNLCILFSVLTEFFICDVIGADDGSAIGEVSFLLGRDGSESLGFGEKDSIGSTV